MPAKGDEVVAKMKADLADIEKRVASDKPKRAFVEIGWNPLFTAGKGTLLDDLLTRAGGINVVTQNDYVGYSVEQLVKDQPEVYLGTKSSLGDPLGGRGAPRVRGAEGDPGRRRSTRWTTTSCRVPVRAWSKACSRSRRSCIPTRSSRGAGEEPWRVRGTDVRPSCCSRSSRRLLAACVAATAFGAVAVPAGRRAALARAGRRGDPARARRRPDRASCACRAWSSPRSSGCVWRARASCTRRSSATRWPIPTSSASHRVPGSAPRSRSPRSASGRASLLAVPAAAFVGAIATIALVAAIATRRGVMDTLSLLLAGVAVSYTLAALTSFVLVVRREQMSRIVFWMMGGLQSASWPQAAVVAVMLVVGTRRAAASTRASSTSCCSATSGRASSGVDVESFKRGVLLAASLMVSAAVSVSRA